MKCPHCGKEIKSPSWRKELAAGRLKGEPIPPALAANREFLEALAAWLESRTKPVSQTVARRALRKCSKFGATASIWALNQAADAGWTGFFPEQYRDRPNRQASQPQMTQEQRDLNLSVLERKIER